LIPRQFSLLVEANRRRLSHREMIQAYTTSAVINYSLGAPEEPILPISFMPNYRAPKTQIANKPTHKLTEDELTDWQSRVANLAAELKLGHGPMLDEIRSQSDAGK
jgi:hypothetical protein